MTYALIYLFEYSSKIQSSYENHKHLLNKFTSVLRVLKQL